MTYLPGLAAALALMWFALSGLTSLQFLILAGISIILALALTIRFRILGRDASPYYRAPQLLLYTCWLVVEIAKANIHVIARVLGSRTAIDPVMVNLRSKATSDLGRALFANSITLTPGTVTVNVDGETLKVHALARSQASAESFDIMNRKAAATADPAAREQS